MYDKFFKRFLDFSLSLIALIVLSPLLLILIISGAIAMRGNPFFEHKRPGRIDKNTGEEQIFTLIKFRTMSNKRDSTGKLLPNNERLNKYGKMLRKSSLDELPELINILKGDMSFIGPRPLRTEYLPLYNDRQRRRHNVRPGLSGLAQVNGRNSISWEKKFDYDVYYVENISFGLDLKIFLQTIFKVFKREGVNKQGDVMMEKFKGSEK